MVMSCCMEWVPELKELWKETYGDTEKEISYFFQTLFQKETTWCCLENEKPVSVIYGIPAMLWTDKQGNKRSFLYLYAGATKKECRGKGCYRDVLQAAEADFPDQILVPVTHLIPYYERLGYKLLSEIPDRIYKMEDLPENQEAFEVPSGIKTLTAGEFSRLREKWFRGEGYVEWKEPYLEYAIRTVKASLGIAAKAEVDGEEHFLLAKTSGEVLKIMETSLSHDQILRYGRGMLEDMGCRQICVEGTVLMGKSKETVTISHFKIPLDE